MKWPNTKVVHVAASGRIKRSAGKINLKWLGVALAIIILLGASFLLTRPDQDLHVIFFDVGQGDSILISQGDTQVLIDGGPNSSTLLPSLGQAMAFYDRKIELVILTHPHSDHLRGLIDVLENYQVDRVICSGAKYDHPSYEEWWHIIEEKSIPVTTASEGYRIGLGEETIISILSPSAPGGDIDNDSLVLLLEYGDYGFLFTGDISTTTEYELLSERAIPDIDVLKVAHHGSDSSTSEEFLRMARPEVAVISVGENSYGHPSPDVIKKLEGSGAFIYRTDQEGNIEFITDGERLWLKTGGRSP